jgi:FAD/FMN-containing dehydrogenase
MGGKWSNWSGGVSCKPRHILSPQNEIELAASIRNAEGPVRAPGSGHSFTPLCASDGALVVLDAFKGLKSTSRDQSLATIFAATPLWAIGPALHAHGLALRNMGDIDRQTLAGVVATGTHGTGRTLGSLSSDVAGFRLILANGDVLNCMPRENAEVFLGGRVAVGTLGVMTEISMALRPRYRLIENNFLLAPEELFRRLDELVSTNRHFEFFWFPYADVAVCKTLNETDKSAPAPRSAEFMRRRGERVGGEARVFAGINEILPALPVLLKPAHGLFSRLMPNAASARWSHEIFLGGRVAVGTLGVMTEISMALRPRYRLIENNFLLAPEELFRRLDELVSTNRHFEFFWFPFADVAVCKTLNETDKPAPAPRSAEFMRRRGERVGGEARVFAGINEILPALPVLLKPAHGLFSRLMPNAASARWSHEIFPSPRPVRFNEMEYAVPLARGADCIREIVAEIRRKRINTGFPLEFRTVAEDDIWLRPFYRRESATIAVHQYYKVDTSRLFDASEAIFRRYEGRPHWGKRHTSSRDELAALYPAFDRFRSLRRELDPGGKFLNPYLRSIFE